MVADGALKQIVADSDPLVPDGRLMAAMNAVNSCARLACSLNGLALQGTDAYRVCCGATLLFSSGLAALEGAAAALRKRATAARHENLQPIGEMAAEAASATYNIALLTQLPSGDADDPQLVRAFLRGVAKPDGVCRWLAALAELVVVFKQQQGRNYPGAWPRCPPACCSATHDGSANRQAPCVHGMSPAAKCGGRLLPCGSLCCSTTPINTAALPSAPCSHPACTDWSGQLHHTCLMLSACVGLMVDSSLSSDWSTVLEALRAERSAGDALVWELIQSTTTAAATALVPGGTAAAAAISSDVWADSWGQLSQGLLALQHCAGLPAVYVQLAAPGPTHLRQLLL